MAAKKIDLTIKEKLQALYQLQLTDTKIDQIEILKGELPMEVSDLEDEIAGLETRLNKLKGSIEDLERDVSNHSSNIKEAEALILRYEKQMDNVKNNREYDALSKELELQRLEIQLSEKRSREAQVYVNSKIETRTAAEERLASKKADLEVKKVELEKIIEKTVKEEEKLKRKSDRQKKHIEARLLNAYSKIRIAYRNGLGVVTVKRNSCGGCFNKIPPQLQLEIGMHKKIIVCEHCGRVLVDDNILAKEVVPTEAEAEKA